MAHGNLTRNSSNWTGRAHRNMGDAFGSRASSRYAAAHARRARIRRMVRGTLRAVGLIAMGAILGGAAAYLGILLHLAARSIL